MRSHTHQHTSVATCRIKVSTKFSCKNPFITFFFKYRAHRQTEKEGLGKNKTLVQLLLAVVHCNTILWFVEVLYDTNTSFWSIMIAEAICLLYHKKYQQICHQMLWCRPMIFSLWHLSVYCRHSGSTLNPPSEMDFNRTAETITLSSAAPLSFLIYVFS